MIAKTARSRKQATSTDFSRNRLGQSRSRNGSYDKEENDAIVLKTFIPRLFILIYIIVKKLFRSAAEITGAHGCGIGAAMKQAEALYLHGAYEGNQRIDNIVITPGRHKGNHKKHSEFQGNYYLPPVKP